MKIYPIKPHQRRMIDEVRKLDVNRLHYIVIQQSSTNQNLTLNELKKHIKLGIREYIRKDLFPIEYRNGIENKLIKYVVFFETTKEFNQSVYDVNADLGSMEMGLHFHMFISATSGAVHLPQLIYNIHSALTSQSNKRRAVKKFDYVKIKDLDEKFIQYHTKQHYLNENPEMLLINT